MTDKHNRFDTVVVGSGFGGSINALRLAQAGKSVVVLERGKRYTPATFPRDVRDVDNLLWRYPLRQHSQGLYDLRFFSGLGAVVASGVGGGSLIYANIHIRPDAVVFDNPRWPREINRQSLDPYYDRVSDELQISPLPEDIKLPKRDAYRLAAAKAGRQIFDPDQAVSWKVGSGPGRSACQLVAECEFGCPHGAKNTIDLTYLAKAEHLGARVSPGCNVLHVEPHDSGYLVHYRTTADSVDRTVWGKYVVLSAGTLGTNEILLRSRDISRTLPNLSNQLGHGYSANGDFLGSIQNAQMDLHPWRGPDVTSVIRYDDSAPLFTMAAPTFSQPVMNVLASLGQGGVGWLKFLAPLIWTFLPLLVPWAFRKGLLSKPVKFTGPHAGDPAHVTNLFAIGQDNANGTIALKRGKLDIQWAYANENSSLIAKMLTAMNEINNAYGGTFAPIATWQLFQRIITVHSLGGCHLSESPQTGVVSPHGEVHGYRRLFVADGSVIPSSIGFHPAMTISAVSEHIADAVIRSVSS
jgi:cholesterol oxidase